MSWTEEQPETSAGPGAAAEDAPAAALFAGDTGALPLDTRRALAHLLAGPSMDGRRHSKLWTALLRDEASIRSRLSELFLDLVIDREAQVAFTQKADAGEIEAPVLLRAAQLTFLDSVLLLFLRQRLTEADARSERAVVSLEEITAHLAVYERAANTDRAGFNRRTQSSVEKIKKHGILQKIRASEDRFEISPALKMLFSAEQIVALADVYRRMAAGETPGVLEGAEPEENAEE